MGGGLVPLTVKKIPKKIKNKKYKIVKSLLY